MVVAFWLPEGLAEVKISSSSSGKRRSAASWRFIESGLKGVRGFSLPEGPPPKDRAQERPKSVPKFDPFFEDGYMTF